MSRFQTIQALRDEGKSLRDIGDAVGLSHERVRQLLKGGEPVSPATGGSSVLDAVERIKQGEVHRRDALWVVHSYEALKRMVDAWAEMVENNEIDRLAYDVRCWRAQRRGEAT